MKHFLLFLGALIALIVFLANLGPLLLLLVTIWLAYLVFKQFLKSESTLAKIGWVILGVIIISIGLPNVYAVIGLAAAIVLYIIYKKWREHPPEQSQTANDPFIHFEEQWNELYK